MSGNRGLAVGGERFTPIQAGGIVASLCLVGVLAGSVLSGTQVNAQRAARAQTQLSSARQNGVEVTGPMNSSWATTPLALSDGSIRASGGVSRTQSRQGSFVIPSVAAATGSVSRVTGSASRGTSSTGLPAGSSSLTLTPGSSLLSTPGATSFSALPQRLQMAGAEALLSPVPVPAPQASAAAAAQASSSAAPQAVAPAPSSATTTSSTTGSGSAVSFSTQPAGITASNFAGIRLGVGGYDISAQSDSAFAQQVVAMTNALILQDLTAGNNGFGVGGYAFPAGAPFGAGNPLFTGQTYGPTWSAGSGIAEPPPSQWAIDPITGLPHDPATGGSVTPGMWATSSWNPDSPSYDASLYTAAGQTPPR